MKITVELDEQEFVQFMEWRKSTAAAVCVHNPRNGPPSVGDDSSIYHLCLSTYVTNILLHHNIKTIGDARLVSRGSDLLKLPYFGRKSLNQLREAIQNFDDPRATHPKD